MDPEIMRNQLVTFVSPTIIEIPTPPLFPMVLARPVATHAEVI